MLPQLRGPRHPHPRPAASLRSPQAHVHGHTFSVTHTWTQKVSSQRGAILYLEVPARKESSLFPASGALALLRNSSMSQ